MTDPLLNHDALGLAGLLRAGEVTPVELLDASLARVEALDGSLNAVITDCADRARERAAAIDPATAPGSFVGVPTFLKDLVDLEGVRRTDGSTSMLNRISDASPDWVHAAEAAGLVMAGKTNTPEFASLPVTDNEAFGPTRNPWNPELSSGGSSGGSAVAVAAGYAPLVHGTDGGGSNRIPASWCGVFGVKPSRRRLASGELDGSHEVFKTHLALGRSVRDVAALFLATQNRASGDHANPFPLVDGLPAFAQPTAGATAGTTAGRVGGSASGRGGGRRLRIALTLDCPFGTSPDPAIAAAIEDTARLCEDLGHEVVPVDNPIDGDEFFEAYRGFFLSRTVGLIPMLEQASGLSIDESGLLSRCTIDMVREGERLPPDAGQRATATFDRLTATMDAFFADHDAWLTPVTNAMPLPVGTPSPSEPRDGRLSELLLAHLAPTNAHGGAAMSVPLWWDPASGLPIGSHFSFPPGGDEVLFGLAGQLEDARPWAHRWAPVSARTT